MKCTLFYLYVLLLINLEKAYSSECEEVSFDRRPRLRYVGGPAIESEPAGGPYSCALLCASYSSCQAVNYDRYGQLCFLFDQIDDRIPQSRRPSSRWSPAGDHFESRQSRPYERRRGFMFIYQIQCLTWRTTTTTTTTQAPWTPPHYPEYPASGSSSGKPPALPRRSCNEAKIRFKNDYGKAKFDPLVGTVIALSEKKCAKHCYEMSLCTSATYNKNSQTCEMMSSYLKGSGQNAKTGHEELHKTESGQAFIYDIKCQGAKVDEERFFFLLLPVLQWLFGQKPNQIRPPHRPFVRPPPYPGFPPPRPPPPFVRPPPYRPPVGPQRPPYPIHPAPRPPVIVTPPPYRPPIPGPPVPGRGSCGRPAIPPRVTEFSLKTLEIGDFRIVGGTEARPHSWPWQASLRYFDRHICGASLIDQRHVVTAAHCVVKSPSPNGYTILMGSHQKNVWVSGQRSYKVIRVTIHPQYNKPKHAFDVAVLTLERMVPISRTVNVICLGQRIVPPSTQCVVSGWGSTQGSGNANRLQQVVVPVLSNAKCNDAQHYTGKIHPSMLCAGYDRGGKDSCQGDSGGPLVCSAGGGRWELQGIVSWGHGCAQRNKPGVYTRITHLKHWIIRQTSGGRSQIVTTPVPVPDYEYGSGGGTGTKDYNQYGSGASAGTRDYNQYDDGEAKTAVDDGFADASEAFSTRNEDNGRTDVSASGRVDYYLY